MIAKNKVKVKSYRRKDGTVVRESVRKVKPGSGDDKFKRHIFKGAKIGALLGGGLGTIVGGSVGLALGGPALAASLAAGSALEGGVKGGLIGGGLGLGTFQVRKAMHSRRPEVRTQLDKVDKEFKQLNEKKPKNDQQRMAMANKAFKLRQKRSDIGANFNRSQNSTITFARRRKSAKEKAAISKGLMGFWDKKGRKRKDKRNTAIKAAAGLGAVAGLSALALKNRGSLGTSVARGSQSLKLIGSAKKATNKAKSTVFGEQLELDLRVKPTKPASAITVKEPKAKKFADKQGELFRLKKAGSPELINRKNWATVTKGDMFGEAVPLSRGKVEKAKARARKSIQPKASDKRGLTVDPIQAMKVEGEKVRKRGPRTSPQSFEPPKTRKERNMRRRAILKSDNVRQARQGLRRKLDKGASQSEIESAMVTVKRMQAARKGRVTKAKNKGTYFNKGY